MTMSKERIPNTKPGH